MVSGRSLDDDSVKTQDIHTFRFIEAESLHQISSIKADNVNMSISFQCILILPLYIKVFSITNRYLTSEERNRVSWKHEVYMNLL